MSAGGVRVADASETSARSGGLGACLAWASVTLALFAVAIGGPVLRPNVTVGPTAFAVGLSACLAIGWATATCDRVTTAFVAAEGALAVGLVGTATDASIGTTVLATVGWLAMATIAAATRAWTTRWGVPIGLAWASVIASAVGAAVVWSR